MKYKVRSKIIPYPGMAAWYFAFVDRELSEKIYKKHHVKKAGFGSIRVTATLGKSKWQTSIFPDKQSGGYVLPLKSKIRRAEGVDAGDVVDFTLEI